MRGALTKVDGVSDIQTDVPNRLCTFKFATNRGDINAQLAKLAQTNEHIAGFELVEGI